MDIRDLDINASAVIEKVEGPHQQRLREIGLIEGNRVDIIAKQGRHLILRMFSSRLAIRLDENIRIFLRD